MGNVYPCRNGLEPCQLFWQFKRGKSSVLIAILVQVRGVYAEIVG